MTADEKPVADLPHEMPPRIAEARLLAGVYEVDKRFGGVHAVKQATLEIHSHQVHCLVGENGAGKSTLVKLLSGVYRPDSGEVRIGAVAGVRSPNGALELGVRTIYQEHTLVPEMTVAENIALGAEPVLGIPGFLDRRRMRQRTRDILEDLGIEGIRPDTRTGMLGIARQQLVEIAKAVSREVTGERIMIMDEPTAPLTLSEIEGLFSIVRRLRDRGVGILYITHRLDELADIGDLVTVMRDGAIVRTATPGDLPKRELIELMVGRKIENLFPPRTSSPGRTVLEIKTDRQDARAGATAPAIEGNGDVSLIACEGEVVALFGLVGAGRTEMVRGLLGVDKHEGYNLTLDGRVRKLRSPGHALRAGVGLVPEDRKKEGIVPEMSVAANISLSSLQGLARASYLPAGRMRKMASGFAERMRIKTPSLQLPIQQLSGGNQQKCVIARALAADPKLMILDEPTRGVDVGARTEVYELINELCAGGRAILMITSDLPEALGMSDRIYVMRDGRLVGHVPTAEASQEKVLALALGADAEDVRRTVAAGDPRTSGKGGSIG